MAALSSVQRRSEMAVSDFRPNPQLGSKLRQLSCLGSTLSLLDAGF